MFRNQSAFLTWPKICDLHSSCKRGKLHLLTVQDIRPLHIRYLSTIDRLFISVRWYFVKIPGKQLIFDKWIYLNDEVLSAFKIKHEGRQGLRKALNRLFRQRTKKINIFTHRISDVFSII